MNPNSDSTAPAFNTTTESENQHSTLFSIGIRQMLAQPKIKDSFLLSLCATLSHLLVCWIICTVTHSQSRIQEVLSLPGFLVLNTSIPNSLIHTDTVHGLYLQIGRRHTRQSTDKP